VPAITGMRVRRSVVEDVFGTTKDWMGRAHFKTRRLTNVATEMSLQILAYNLKRGLSPALGESDRQNRKVAPRIGPFMYTSKPIGVWLTE
jgi:Transposase DDE domain